jgi:hypothetical protein
MGTLGGQVGAARAAALRHQAEAYRPLTPTLSVVVYQ